MKKLSGLLVIIMLMMLTSCVNPNYQKYEDVCSCQELDKVNKFITDNMKSANNMSDEEMEDVIEELRKTAIETNCHQKLMLHNGESGRIMYETVKLDSCEKIMDIKYR